MTLSDMMTVYDSEHVNCTLCKMGTVAKFVILRWAEIAILRPYCIVCVYSDPPASPG